MPLGELFYEESGKIVGTRLLPDGRIEQTLQGSGKLSGVDINSLYTFVGTRHSDGAIVIEGGGVSTTADGDSITIKTWGVRQTTAAGLKARSRGFDIWQTASQKLARLNNTTYVWETEFDEAGNYQLKVWEWG